MLFVDSTLLGVFVGFKGLFGGVRLGVGLSCDREGVCLLVLLMRLVWRFVLRMNLWLSQVNQVDSLWMPNAALADCC